MQSISFTTLLAAGGHASYKPLISNDAAIFGILMLMLAVVFFTSSSQNRWIKLFYKIFPMLLLCYFLPSLLTLFRVVNPDESKLYYVASRYLLPASLILLTISVDLKAVLRLGPKALIMFLTGTVGVVFGGPLAILIVSTFSPNLVMQTEGVDTWRGMSTVAGSWIGGGANQAAMKEIFMPEDLVTAPEIGVTYIETTGTPFAAPAPFAIPVKSRALDRLYSVMVAVDVIVAEVWMLFLLLGVGKAKAIDRFFKADSSSIDELQKKMESFSKKSARVPTTVDFMVLGAIAFGVTAACHYMADLIAPWIGENLPLLEKFSLNSQFFWLIVLATTIGLILSFTKVRNYEGVGASKIGTVFIFILVATIGMKMDITALFKNPGLFLVGGIWMLIHVVLLLVVGYVIRAPYFFLAVGSKANIGGAASAPVVAAAFHPSLAPVGVLLAVLGYVLGTYGAYLCALMMQAVTPSAGG